MKSGRADVSLIVCTRDRPEKLTACLASIDKAARHAPGIAVECIVVDNGSSASARKIVDVQTARCACTVIFSEEPIQGLSRARNRGIQSASGSIVAFTDDDCRLDPDFFTALVRVHEHIPGPALVGGMVTLGDPDDAEFSLREGNEWERFRPGHVPGGFLIGANLSMSMSTIERIGGFDERLGAGSSLRSAEDTDYLIRAALLDVPIHYCPLMKVAHHHGRSTRAEVLGLHRSYSLGNGALYAKHWKNAPWLIRQLRWTVRACVRETLTGRQFDQRNQLSHFSVLRGNLAGMARFSRLAQRCVPEVAEPSALSK